jgi:hypothetical protein
MWAAKSRSSNASRGKNDATVGTLGGKPVALTVIEIFAEIPGTPPGVLMRRMINWPKAASLGPIM